MPLISAISSIPIDVIDGGTGTNTLTSGGVLIGAGSSAVSATLTPSGLTSLSAGTLGATTTVTAGTDLTATAGNVIVSGTGKGLTLPVSIPSPGAGPITANARAGSCAFSSVSIATNADQTFVINNSLITSSAQIVLLSMWGATTGSALSIKAITLDGTAHTISIVVTNGNGVAIVTSVANIVFNFLLLN